MVKFKMIGGFSMSNNASSFAKGIAAGMVVGAAVVTFLDPISDKQKHKLQRKTHGMFKSIGGVLDTAMDIMK